MAYVETSIDFFEYGLMACRIKYAAFLYDEFRKQHRHHQALTLAVRQANISGDMLRGYLPRHNELKRILRNQNIIDMRASGYSVNMIAESLGIHRCTVSRVLDDHATRVNAAKRYERHKIRGRLKYGDPRLDHSFVIC